MPFREPTSPLFTRYFYGWNRLEGRSRHDDFAPGLSAATADPLWALGRQWQMLELKGEDGGTPIHVDLAYEEVGLDRLKLGAQPFDELEPLPVEVLVEREDVEWDWRLRVRAGQHFERLVRLDPNVDTAVADALITTLRADHPIQLPTEPEALAELDQASRRFVSFMAGRAIDGEALLARVSSGIPPLAVSQQLQDQFTGWYERLYSRGSGRASPAWNSQQLDFDFRLRSANPDLPGPVHAVSYRTGSIDWEAFALERASSQPLSAPISVQLTPVHVTYAGQPMRRWWEFEDRAVYLPALDTAKTDLAKLVLLEFALAFGDDWFVVPLTAKTNSMVRVRSLRVRDCFGQVTVIPPARESATDPLEHWEVFALAPSAQGGQSGDFLFVPPITGVREESPIVEEVRLAPDEDSNVVWGIEHTVPNQLGEPTGGFAAHLELLRRLRDDADEQPAPGPVETPTSEPSPPNIAYVLSTSVPANWIPFIAAEPYAGSGLPPRSVRLQRATMVATESAAGQRSIAPLSRLLTNVNWLMEEAVGREGVRVELRRQRMRAPTGETYVWLGRKIGAGKGEARSGLRFDVVRER